MEVKSKVIVVYIPAKLSAGGSVLLRDLLLSAPKHLRIILVSPEARTLGNAILESRVICLRIKPTFMGRIMVEYRLARIKSIRVSLICFSGLPILFKTRVRTIVYLQNYFIAAGASIKMLALRDFVSVAVKRAYFFWFLRDSNVWVQTHSMLRELRKNGLYRVEVKPYAPSPITLLSQQDRCDQPLFDFIYIASTQKYKNHMRLIEAWKILSLDHRKYSLCLTLSDNPVDRKLKGKIEKIAEKYGLLIFFCSAETSNRHSLYLKAKCLLYVSLHESLGLPLVEASQLNMPIIAPELDYVREVCYPHQTFNPYSAYSIANAVMRYMSPGASFAPRMPLASDFWHNPI